MVEHYYTGFRTATTVTMLKIRKIPPANIQLKNSTAPICSMLFPPFLVGCFFYLLMKLKNKRTNVQQTGKSDEAVNENVDEHDSRLLEISFWASSASLLPSSLTVFSSFTLPFFCSGQPGLLHFDFAFCRFSHLPVSFKCRYRQEDISSRISHSWAISLLISAAAAIATRIFPPA